MQDLQLHSAVTWHIEETSAPDHVHDNPMLLFREENGVRRSYPAVEVSGAAGNPGLYPYSEDYGLILRGPHPRYPAARAMLVMAGAHSLGTGAACMTATEPKLIREIAGRLREVGCDISDAGAGFWVLVKGLLSEQLTQSDGDALPPVLDRVVVEDVGSL